MSLQLFLQLPPKVLSRELASTSPAPYASNPCCNKEIFPESIFRCAALCPLQRRSHVNKPVARLQKIASATKMALQSLVVPPLCAP